MSSIAKSESVGAFTSPRNLICCFHKEGRLLFIQSTHGRVLFKRPVF